MTENQLSGKLPALNFDEFTFITTCPECDAEFEAGDIGLDGGERQRKADQLIYNKALALIQQKNEQIADQQKRIAELTEAEKTGLSVKIAQELCAQFDYDAPVANSWELASDSTKQFWLKIADIALMVIEEEKNEQIEKLEQYNIRQNCKHYTQTKQGLRECCDDFENGCFGCPKKGEE